MIARTTPRHLPRAGLRAPPSAAPDDVNRSRISAPIPMAGPADRVRAHPLLRAVRASEAEGIAAAVPAVAERLGPTGVRIHSRCRGPAALEWPGPDEGPRTTDPAPSPTPGATGKGLLRRNRSFSTSKIVLPGWHCPRCVRSLASSGCSVTHPALLPAHKPKSEPIPPTDQHVFPSPRGIADFQTP